MGSHKTSLPQIFSGFSFCYIVILHKTGRLREKIDKGAKIVITDVLTIESSRASKKSPVLNQQQLHRDSSVVKNLASGQLYHIVLSNNYVHNCNEVTTSNFKSDLAKYSFFSRKKEVT